MLNVLCQNHEAKFPIHGYYIKGSGKNCYIIGHRDPLCSGNHEVYLGEYTYESAKYILEEMFEKEESNTGKDAFYTMPSKF